ncbi:carbohydrate ABC transporter permease [Romboutsia weinsteinii]|uniref:Carbohydrate ABC transporter permease n=1 Tax=Romboutsia weinsteinii TaxID=2020949 RepID=A0A371J750_9FIRM|nr:carbohydrate ABC transporter permease [Romboutsia weinsteinii]RDY28533.1 carbohydrate ABC transporter permease [Romboutsia weinsteinii]
MKKQKLGKVLVYTILIIYALITLYPFIWGLSASFKPYNEIVGGGLSIFSENFSLDNYKYIFNVGSDFLKWFGNSFFIATVGTLLNLLFNSMAGYALARLRFPGKNQLFYIILAVMMVPGQILIIPNYLIIKNLGMLNSFSAVIIPAAINATYIFMMRQFFLNFPKEVEEAASLDGLTRTQTFFKIVLPMAKPALATQAIFVFMSFWNEFMKPMLYLNSPEKYTLTLGLQMFQTQYVAQWHYIMAASMITITPILIMYAVFNKYFMEGVRIGGDK